MTETDSLGRYIVNSCPDIFTLNVTAFGYEAYANSIESSDLVNNTLTTKLNVTTIGEIVVTDQAKPRMVREGNKFVIDKIENSPYAKGNNTYTFLRYIPLLDVPVFEGAIKMANGNNLSLQINGRFSNMPMEAMLKNLSTEDIERIEIIAQSGSEYSAGGRGGIINIVLKKRPDEGMKYSLYLADAHRNINSQNGSFSLSYSGEKTFITSGLYLNNNRYDKETDVNYRFYSDDQQFQQQSYSKSRSTIVSAYLNLNYEINKRNTLGFRVSAAGNDTKNTNTTTSDYSSLSSGIIDSTYISSYKTTNPVKFTDLNVNLNYTLKTDEQGSVFMADFDYSMRRPEVRTYNLFDKINGGVPIRESDFLQRDITDLNAFGLQTRYNHVFSSGSKLNSGISVTGADTNYDYFFGNNNLGGGLYKRP